MYCSVLELSSKGLLFWRKTTELTKTGGHDKKYCFWTKFAKFLIFLLSGERKMTFFEANFLKLFQMAKFGICGKVFGEICIF